MTDCCEVVITSDNPTWLAWFSQKLVDEQLAAAAHIVDQIRSIYRWQGRIHDRAEGRVILHTRLSLVPAIVERVDQAHSYEVPCVAATPIIGGNPRYLDWIREVTREPDQL